MSHSIGSMCVLTQTKDTQQCSQLSGLQDFKHATPSSFYGKKTLLKETTTTKNVTFFHDFLILEEIPFLSPIRTCDRRNPNLITVGW